MKRRLRCGLLIALLLLTAAACSGGSTTTQGQEDASAADPVAVDTDLAGEGGATTDGGPTGGRPDAEDSVDDQTDDQADDVAERAVAEPTTEIGKVPVQLFFPARNAGGLVGEAREIFETLTPGDRIRQIVADLIAGPTSKDAVAALPKGTALRQVYVMDGGVAYLDFSSELADGLNGGSRIEMLTVYAIVDSVVLNVREVTRVALLIGGRSIETLNGHLDLRRPLKADRRLIVGG